MSERMSGPGIVVRVTIVGVMGAAGVACSNPEGSEIDSTAFQEVLHPTHEAVYTPTQPYILIERPIIEPTRLPTATPTPERNELLVKVLGERDMENYMWLLNAEAYGIIDAVTLGHVSKEDALDALILIIRSTENRRNNPGVGGGGENLDDVLAHPNQYPTCVSNRTIENTCTVITKEREELYLEALQNYFLDDYRGPFPEMFIDSYHSQVEKGCSPDAIFLLFEGAGGQFLCYYQGLWYAIVPTAEIPSRSEQDHVDLHNLQR